ncbi:MAG: hypothetical protein RMM29_04460 [Planctomycetota bacterium]|nr:hypothetical protein [Planctomycetota bacterium]MDW8372888.1 hypothetical protein [Planctomycetota bacterium]
MSARRWAWALAGILAACSARPEPAPPPAPSAPPWAAEAGERAGRLSVIETADGRDAQEALASARRAAYGALAAYRGVQVQALFSAVTAEVRHDQAQALVDRAVQATRVASEQLVARALPGRQAVVDLPDGRVRAWVELTIALDDLLPERRLQELLQQPRGAARRAALGELAQQWLAGDALQRRLAPLAAQAAVNDGGGAAELIQLARCHFLLGDLPAARATLEAAAQVIEGSAPEVFAAFCTLESELAAQAESARELAERVQALARTLAASGGLRAAVRQGADGVQLTLVIAGSPRRLLGLWLDAEELSALPAAALGAQPVHGALQLRLPPARGTLLVLALAPDDPLVRTLPALPRLDLAQPAATALQAWRSALRELAARPTPAGAALLLDR